MGISITDFVGASIAIISSLLTIGIFNGVMKTKVQDMKEDISSLKKERDDYYVRKDYFQATVEPIQESITEMERDIKRILAIVSRYEPKDAKRNE